MPCWLGSSECQQEPQKKARKMVLIEKVPFTCKQLMCYLLIQYITFSRNCARKTLLVSVTVREGKYQEHEYLNIFLDSEFSLLQNRLLIDHDKVIKFHFVLGKLFEIVAVFEYIVISSGKLGK